MKRLLFLLVLMGAQSFGMYGEDPAVFDLLRPDPRYCQPFVDLYWAIQNQDIKRLREIMPNSQPEWIHAEFMNAYNLPNTPEKQKIIDLMRTEFSNKKQSQLKWLADQADKSAAQLQNTYLSRRAHLISLKMD